MVSDSVDGEFGVVESAGEVVVGDDALGPWRRRWVQA